MGAVLLQAVRADAGADWGGGADPGLWDDGEDRVRLLPLRTRPVLPRTLPQPAHRALDALRAGDVRADHRQPEISRTLRDGVVPRRDARAASCGISGFSLPLRTNAASNLFRHQRLWPVPAAAGLVPQLLGDCRRPAGDHHQSALGAWDGRQLARAHESCRRKIFAGDDGWRYSLRRS